MLRLSQHYFRVFLASLGILGGSGVISRSTDFGEFRSVEKNGRRLLSAEIDNGEIEKFARFLSKVPVAASGSAHYDALAEQAFKADRAHPISMNLEPTPTQIYAAALALRSGLASNSRPDHDPHAPAGKCGPDFKESADLYLQLKRNMVDVSDIGATDRIEALSPLKQAMKL